MPKALELELKKTARKKFPKDKKRQDAYTYGTLREFQKVKTVTDWRPRQKRKVI